MPTSRPRLFESESRAAADELEGGRLRLGVRGRHNSCESFRSRMALQGLTECYCAGDPEGDPSPAILGSRSRSIMIIRSSKSPPSEEGSSQATQAGQPCIIMIMNCWASSRVQGLCRNATPSQWLSADNRL
eukprot:2458108-Rhodomonas_salina.1